MERERERLEFALKRILGVASRRKNDAVARTAQELLTMVHGMQSPADDRTDGRQPQGLEEIRFKALLLVDELMIMTNLEIREVLFPLPEIKRSTRQFATRFSSNYFAWLSDEERYTPERLMGILEGDLRELEIAKAHIQRRLDHG